MIRKLRKFTTKLEEKELSKLKKKASPKQIINNIHITTPPQSPKEKFFGLAHSPSSKFTRAATTYDAEEQEVVETLDEKIAKILDKYK